MEILDKAKTTQPNQRKSIEITEGNSKSKEITENIHKSKNIDETQRKVKEPMVKDLI